MGQIHVAIINVPGAVHVHPTLTILSTLIRRGFRVTYVTSERFRSTVSALGAEVVLCPRWEPPYARAEKGECLPMEQQFATDLIDLASRTLSAISAFYESNRPDLVLYDTFALAGLILADRLGIPSLRTTTHFLHDESNLKSPIVPPAMETIMIEFSARADQLLHENGISERNVIFRRDVSTIYFYLRELQLSQHSFDNKSIYAARCSAERPYLGRWKGKHITNRQSVLVSASTTYIQGHQYYRACAEAVSELGWHAVLAVGSKTEAAALEPLPSFCEISYGVPLIMIMPHVDMIICTGGMTTSMEALYHGLPLLLLTHGKPEVEMYAANIQEHGLGIHLRNGVTAKAIQDSISQMSRDEVLLSNVARVRDRTRTSPGGEEAVNWIEAHLDQTHLS